MLTLAAQSETVHAAAEAVEATGMVNLAKFIPLLPAIGMVACASLGLSRSGSVRVLAAPIGIAAVALSFVLSVLVLIGFDPSGPAQIVHGFTWLGIGDFAADFSFYIDALTIVMLMVVTGVGTLIFIYASGYMHGDPGYFRFFSYFCLFIVAMTLLVLADNLVLLYLGWEGVGLASYLLIGFYYRKPSARDAAKKAFIVNRVGDFGFGLGIMGTFLLFGAVQYDAVLAQATAANVAALEGWRHTLAMAIPFLLMLGAFGKSAQLPLHVWLPDAMEGPTPVSALIHAATMVTAGVYMIARLLPIFALNATALYVVAAVGGITALFAATIALTQHDIKRVWAYSTISQLGYMFLGVGVLGAFGAVFHLFTHAFFKALLFLTAGSVMHALSGQLDMRKMSGMARKMPVTAALMLAGCLALAGFPLLAGFWSKDQILYNALNTYPLLGWIGVVTALITAFYTFRLWFRVFLGPTEYEMGREHHGYEMDHAPDDHHHGPHEMPWLMNGPLVVLALGAILAGLFGGWVQSSVESATPGIAARALHHEQGPAAADLPGEQGGGEQASAGDAREGPARIAAHPSAPRSQGSPALPLDGGPGHAAPPGLLNAPKHKGDPGYTSHLSVGLVSGIGAIAMILLAGYFHWLRRDAAEKVVSAVKPVFFVLNRKYFVDELYHWTIVQPLRGIGWIGFRIVDGLLLDRLIYDGLGRFLPWIVGEAQSPTMRGRLQGYALMMGLGVLLVVAVVAYAVLL